MNVYPVLSRIYRNWTEGRITTNSSDLQGWRAGAGPVCCLAGRAVTVWYSQSAEHEQFQQQGQRRQPGQRRMHRQEQGQHRQEGQPQFHLCGLTPRQSAAGVAPGTEREGGPGQQCNSDSFEYFTQVSILLCKVC